MPRLVDEVRVLVNGKSDEVFGILLDASNLPKVKHAERKPYGPLKKGTVETIHLPWFQSATYRVVELNRRTRKYAVKILQASCSARGTVHVEVVHAVGGCEIALALDITSSLSRPPCRDWLTVILASRIEEQLSFMRVLDQQIACACPAAPLPAMPIR